MTAEKKPGWKFLLLGAVVDEPGSSQEYKTGDWRAFRPFVIKEKCVNCLICWIYCPDSAIVRQEKWVDVDYDYCKGCGICAKECPKQAISMGDEPK